MPRIISLAAKKAFEIFDIDKSGQISADELVKILTRDCPIGKPLSLADAKEIIADFDKSETGELNLEEFAECWDNIGAGQSVTALENHSLYDDAINAPGVKDEIKRIFNKIDVSGDGALEVDELDEIVAVYQGHAFDEDEFFGYWDVMGAHGDHVGHHHADDHKSGDIDLQEFGWYLADCAGLADYRDGGLDGYDTDTKAHMMKKTIEEFEHAIDYIHERQKRNEHPLHLDDAHRAKYSEILKGHRKQVADLFKAIDQDNSGTLDLAELEDIIKEVEGGKFDEKEFFAFFKGKTPDDHLSQMEFGWYIADQAGENDKVYDFIQKCTEVRQKVHEHYRLQRIMGDRT